MALPNPSMSFSPFAILTAEEMNDLVENIESLSDGTGFDTGAIDGSVVLQNNTVPASKIDFTTGIWGEELGRVTLASSGDLLSIPSIPVRNYLKIYVHVSSTGGTINMLMRFNNDSGSSYAYRIDGGTAAVNQSSYEIAGAVASQLFTFTAELVNISTVEKMLSGVRVSNFAGTGAGTAPNKSFQEAKWANTSSAITRIDIINSGTGDYATGSQMVIVGHN